MAIITTPKTLDTLVCDTLWENPWNGSAYSTTSLAAAGGTITFNKSITNYDLIYILSGSDSMKNVLANFYEPHVGAYYRIMKGTSASSGRGAFVREFIFLDDVTFLSVCTQSQGTSNVATVCVPLKIVGIKGVREV